MQSDRSEPAPPRVVVHILKGKSARKAREMRGATLLIGSEPHCDVQMRSPRVAGRHCLICRRNGAVSVQALDPDFPVTVNGQATTEALVKDGDRLTVGPFEIGITIETSTVLEVDENTAEAEAHSPPAVRPAGEAAPGPITDSGEKTMAPEPQGAKRNPPPLSSELAAKLAQLEERQQQLDRHQQQLAEQRAALDQTYKEQAKRECALAEQSERLLRQQTQLRLAEQELEQRRLQHTEELLQYDRHKKSLDEQRGKAQRVRRRLVEKYRDRHRALKQLAGQIEQKAAELDARSRAFDRDFARFQQIKLETEAQSQELARQSVSLADRGLEIERREKELSAQSIRLEQELTNLNIRERALAALQAQVGEEKARLAEQDALAYANRQQAQQQLEAAERRAKDLERKAQALELERQTFDKQQQHLRELARGIEQQRLQAAQREKELAARHTELQAEAERLAAECARLEESDRQLAVRESAVAEQTRVLQATEAEVARRGSALVTAQADLERQSAELDVVQQFLAQRRDELEAESDRHRRDQERHETEKARWTSHWQEAREQWIEAGERLALAEALVSETDERAADLEQREAALEAKRQSFAEAQDRFAGEQRQLEELLNAANRKALELERAHKRLAKEHSELEQRRVQVVERERQWVEEVAARRGELKSQMEQLQRDKTRLEQQSLVQRRHVERLRHVAAKMVERRRELQKKLHRLESTGTEGERFPTNDVPAAAPAPAAATSVPPASAVVADPSAVPKVIARPAQPKPRTQVHFPAMGAATILGVIHHGTMATTLRAAHPDFSGPVALRLLAARWCREANLKNGYAMSVKSAATFRHPNVAAVYKFFQHEDRFGLLREFVPGCSLAELVGKPISPRLVVHLCRQAVSALAAAQAAGFVHRGLQPGRLILTPAGVLKFLGYGEPFWVRQFYRCERGRTAAAYCAPEELEVDRSVDVRSDLFAVGRIVSDLAAGIASDPVRGAPQASSGFPNAFVEILSQMTAGEPARRCRSLRTLLSELDDILADPHLAGEARFQPAAG